jgi:site-specific DNA recombinase
VPPLIDAETFAAVQAQLRKNQVTAKRNRRHDYLLAGGFLRCARCGRMMTGRVTSRGQRRYRCTSRSNVLDITHRCSGSLNAEEVEALVWQRVEEVLQTPTLIAAEVERQQARSEEVIAELRRNLDLMHDALARCQREEARWTQAYAAEVIDLAELKAYRADIAARRQGLHEQQQSVQAQLDSVHQGMAQVVGLIDYCARVRASLQTFDVTEKRLALQALAIQATWASDQPLQITGSLPLEEETIASNAHYRAVCPARWRGPSHAWAEDWQQPGGILDGEPRWPGL